MRTRVLMIFQLFAVVLLLLLGVSVQAMDFVQYHAALSHTSDRLHACTKAEKALPGSTKEELDTLSRMWAAPISVRMPDGRIEAADLTWISTELRHISRRRSAQRSGDIAKLAEQVDALSLATSAPHRLHATPAAARTALNAVLAESSFHPSKFDEWIQRETYKVLQAIDRVLSRIPARYSSVLGWILTGLLILAVAAALVYLILSIIRIRSYETPHTREIRKPTTSSPKRPTVDELLAEAEVEASRGHFRDALRKVYLASLLSLIAEV